MVYPFLAFLAVVLLLLLGVIYDSCDIRSYHVLIESGVLGVYVCLFLTLNEILLGDGNLESCCIDILLVRVVQVDTCGPSNVYVQDILLNRVANYVELDVLDTGLGHQLGLIDHIGRSLDILLGDEAGRDVILHAGNCAGNTGLYRGCCYCLCRGVDRLGSIFV